MAPSASSLPYNFQFEIHRPSKDFLRILRSVGAEGDIFTRQQVLFYLREYIIVNRLFDLRDPRVVKLDDDPLASILDVKSFLIDDIEKLIGDQASKSGSSRCFEDDCDRFESKSNCRDIFIQKTPAIATSEDLAHSCSDSNPLTESCFDSIPNLIESSICSSALPRDSRSHHSKQASFCSRIERLAKSDLAPALLPPTSSLPLSRCPSAPSSPSPSSASKQPTSPFSVPAWLPWFFSHQRLSSTSVASDEKSETLSLQGYETAPVEDSSDDLWYLESSSAGAVGIGVEPAVGVESAVDQGFQVEFEVDSSTEVDEEDAEEEEEEEEEEEDSAEENNDEEDEDLLGEESVDFAFLSRVTSSCSRADSDVEFWADHSSDEDDEDSEEEGVEFEFEEEDRQQRRLIEGEEASSTDSDSDLESSQDQWVCGECSTRNRPYVRFCERCWKLRPGWLRKMRRGGRNADAKDDGSDGEESSGHQREDEEEAEENPLVDVEPDDDDDEETSRAEVDERGDGAIEGVDVPVGLLDFDWQGENHPELVETDGAVGVRDVHARVGLTSASISSTYATSASATLSASSFVASTASLAASTASLAASTASIQSSIPDDDSEFRCESQASLFSQSSIFSVASSQRDNETRTDADSARDSGAASSLSTVGSQDGARGGGAASSLSTIGSQDSGFGGSQDSFLVSGGAFAATADCARVGGMPTSVRRGVLCRRDTLDVDDVKLFLQDEDPIFAVSNESSPSAKSTTQTTSVATTASRLSSKSSTLPPNLSLFAKEESSYSPSKVYWEEDEEEANDGRRYSFDRLTDTFAVDNYWRRFGRRDPIRFDESVEESGLSSLDSQTSEGFFEETRKGVDRTEVVGAKDKLTLSRHPKTLPSRFPPHSVHTITSSSASDADMCDSTPPFSQRRRHFTPTKQRSPFNESPSSRGGCDPGRTTSALFRAPSAKMSQKTMDTITMADSGSAATESRRQTPCMADDFVECRFDNENKSANSSQDQDSKKEAMEIMDSLPKLDRLRNISGGSSATGSSTEELSTASGDDDLFKRPADRPMFSRKRKDRQSSGSSTASAFRHAASTSQHQPKREHKRGKGLSPHRSSTVIFSIRGSSPEGLTAATPSITTPSSALFSSSSPSFGRTPDAFATLLNSHGTTISVNSGSITSFTVKKRSKNRQSKSRDGVSTEASSESSLRRSSTTSTAATTESSTQYDGGDVEASSQRQDAQATTPPPRRVETSTDDSLNDKCIICLTRPKNASIIHGYLGHQVCCCKCARKLRRLGKPCPICRRPIQHIVKNVIV